jgi:glutamate N-acetyltransferase/amino-acid N-acetyltransferase
MNNDNYIIPGFKSSAVASGIGTKKGLDLALIFSEKETQAAAVFTRNQVKAAPVILSMENMKKGKVRAVLANAGNANACTGREGFENAQKSAEAVARELGISVSEVIVASTGVIGAQLKMDRFHDSVKDLMNGLSAENLTRVAEAIRTTDAFPKISLFQGQAGDNSYSLLGMAKGAGMIMPNMATMLCFILSDIQIEQTQLQGALNQGLAPSFNRISVDSDTSTNDMVLIMTNGLAGNGPLSPADYESFKTGLTRVMTDLATMIVKDGEGNTKVVYVKIKGAASPSDALNAARTVSNSPLVKTAFYGQDPNWGRIMMALGKTDIQMKEQAVNISVDDIMIVKEGLGLGIGPEKEAAQKMKNESFSLTIDLQQGEFEDQYITSDLSHDYISINADYRS